MNPENKEFSLEKKLRQIILECSELNKQEFSSFCEKGFSADDLLKLKEKNFHFYEGKVRQCLKKNDQIFLCHTDRLSAFDQLVGYLPGKGAMLTKISAFWFNKLAEAKIPTAYLSTVDDRIIKQEALTPIPMEMICRAYFAGSLIKAREQGINSISGVKIPDTIKPYEAFAKPILTPTSKAELGKHDEPMSPEELVQEKIISKTEWEFIAQTSLKIFKLGQKVYEEHGWILADTKYEFARSKDGTIKVIDEVHTPDSSRLWFQESYKENLAKGKAPKMFDKEKIRRYLKDKGYQGDGPIPEIPREKLLDLAKNYLEVTETLTEEKVEFKALDYRKLL